MIGDVSTGEDGVNGRKERLVNNKREKRIGFHGPLSFVGFAESIRPGSMFSSAHTVHIGLDMEGVLNIEALERSCAELGRQHAMLWARLERHDAVRPELVLESPGTLSVSIIHDESGDGFTGKIAEVLAIDPEAPPLMKAVLFCKDRDIYQLVLVAHGLCADNWTLKLFARSFVQLYNHYCGEGPRPTFPPADSYVRIIEDDKENWTADGSARAAQFWRKYLEDIPVMKYPTDSPRRTEEDAYRLGRSSVRLSQISLEDLREASARYGTTPFVLLLASFAKVISVGADEEDVVLPTLWSCRDDPKVDEIAGSMVNALITRLRIRNDLPVGEYLKEASSAVFQTYKYAWTPVDKVAEQVPVAGAILADPEYVRLMFQYIPPFIGREDSIYNMKTTIVDSIEGSGSTRLSEEPFPQDLLFTVTDDTENLIVKTTYDAGLFCSETISGMVNSYEEVLGKILGSSTLIVGNLL